MFCRNCGKDVPENAEVCVNCGMKPLMGKKFCQNCGAETKENQEVCTKCGVKLKSSMGKGAKSKLVAGLLGIFLGWLGIHKFYLGYTVPGIIVLLISIIGGLPTIGGSILVMWIFGLIEGIIYLTKSDEDFDELYVQNKKQWF
ncbi:MAG: TM2 domain-containing protein [Candidatus Tenebribacter davisii]|jgi:TM2 domain-containing membrane protein YozV/ribosomal protein L40E|nr:TM2 domain-containing protein [Candidatus Tenebribacter davisii]